MHVSFNIYFCHLSIFSFLFCIFPSNFILYFAYTIPFSFLFAFIKSKFQSDLIKNDSIMTPICNCEHVIDYGEIKEEEEEIDPSVKLLRFLEEKEIEIQPHEEEIEVINLGIKDDKKEIKIGTLIRRDV